MAYRLPVGPAGGVLRHRQQAVRDRLPLGADQELAIGVVVGAGHETPPAIHVDRRPLLHPQIVIGQEEQIVGELVGQRPLPIAVQLGQVHAKGVPVGPHADLAREVGVGDGQRRADDVIGEAVHHTPHAGARPDAVLSIEDNVGGDPVNFVLVQAHRADCHLAVADVIEHGRGLLEGVFQVIQKGAIVAGIPLER